MSALDDARRVNAKIESGLIRFFDHLVANTFTSVVDGSPLTASPGQPVDEGVLRGSYEVRRPSLHQAEVSSDVPYARAIEENYDNKSFRSGGPHSVKLTIAGMPNLAEDAMRKTHSEGVA